MAEVPNRSLGELADLFARDYLLHVVASHITSWAVSRDLVDPAASGVFAGLEKPAPTPARSRVLMDDEIRRLWPVIQDEPPREIGISGTRVPNGSA